MFEEARLPSGRLPCCGWLLLASRALTQRRRDQELRFTVHDGPDYYQLKVSVFNDDKRTELIGEAWIDLRDIIVPGGGQNDLWQNLSCKGKYAGDIRIEITYYDSRPKPEKPVAKAKPVNSETISVAGQQKVPKRRPLPSDPYTGQPPAQPPQPVSSHGPTPPRPQPNTPRDYTPELSTPDHGQMPPRLPQPNPPTPYPPNHTASLSGQYGTPPSLRHRHHDNYSTGTSSTYQAPPIRADAPRGSPDRDRYPSYADELDYPPSHQGHTPDMRYTPSATYGAMPSDPAFGAAIEDDRPPPPPAHRITPGGTPDIKHQSLTPPIMRKDVLRNEAHRQSAPSNAYPGRPVYRGFDLSPAAIPVANDSYAGGSHSPYDSHHRSLQPTVEDVPDSPGSGLEEYRRNSVSRTSPLAESEYRHDPAPPPLSLGGRNSAIVGQYNNAHRQNPSPDYARSDEILCNSQQNSAPYPLGNEQELYGTQMRASTIPIPAALIPGADPGLSMEISQRLNERGRHDRRHLQSAPQAPPVGSVRGRQMIELLPSYSAPAETSEHFSAPQYGSDAYERGSTGYSGRSSSQQSPAKRGFSPGQSPNGQHTIRRKSVSPAPPPAGRRLSGIPFGPDDYNALNPALALPATPKESESRASREYDEIDGVIITHDGREVDPSDHLPMDTWAPEPEPKAGKNLLANTRPSLTGPQPPPSSGRKALRIRERPASSIPPATYISPDAPLPPPSTGRNRLQKKANRNSAMPAMMSGANGPGHSPLAPLHQPHERNNFAPRSPARASTLDYENHAPLPTYDMTPIPHAGRDHSASAPPIPAKIPLSAAGQMVPTGYGGDTALMEEMSRINIGSGRARRHAQRSAIGGY